MPVLGLVVAGPYDEAILTTFVGRIRPERATVHCRPCGDDARVTRFFKELLEDFKFVNAGGAVDKAIVVRDAHRKPPAQLLGKLMVGFNASSYSFPVKFVIVLPEPEAWLLADHKALSAVGAERGRATTFPPASSSPEILADPKRELRVRLGKARVAYTKVAAQRLAELADIDTIEYWCPSFAQFKAAIKDC